MKNWKILCFLMAVSALFFSCKKEGCTDSNAINFDSDAKKENNACQYKNGTKESFDTYDVQDSTTGPFQNVTYKNYSIEIKADPANANGMLIGNYGNSQNQLTGLPLEVPCQIIGDSIFVSFQVIEGDNIPGLSFDDFTIHAQTGYLTTDSIFLEVSYLKNGGDPYYGHAWGKKN